MLNRGDILNKRETSLDALCIALMFSCNSLSKLLNFIPGISAIIVISSFITFLWIRGLPSKNNISSLILFLAVIFIGFARQALLGNWCNPVFKSLMNFIILGIPFLSLSYYQLRYKRILEYLVLLGLVMTPLNIKECLLEYISLNSDDSQMVSSYNILFFIIPSAIICFYNTNKWIKLFAIAEVLLGLLFLILFGSKGAVLAIFLGCFLVFVYRKNRSVKILSLKTIITTISVCLLFSNLDGILTYTNDMLNRYGIVSSAIPELLAKISSNDIDQITSGRNVIYTQTIKEISHSPIWGYGIASFDNYSGNYPHNLFLQLLYEGGIIVCFPYTLLFFMLLNQLNSNKTPLEKRYFIIFIFSAGLVRLMLSYSFWESQLFWFSIGIVLKNLKFTNKTNGDKRLYYCSSGI